MAFLNIFVAHTVRNEIVLIRLATSIKSIAIDRFRQDRIKMSGEMALMRPETSSSLVSIILRPEKVAVGNQPPTGCLEKEISGLFRR
jgi:hypothetical protein